RLSFVAWITNSNHRHDVRWILADSLPSVGSLNAMIGRSFDGSMSRLQYVYLFLTREPSVFHVNVSGRRSERHPSDSFTIEFSQSSFTPSSLRSRRMPLSYQLTYRHGIRPTIVWSCEDERSPGRKTPSTVPVPLARNENRALDLEREHHGLERRCVAIRHHVINELLVRINILIGVIVRPRPLWSRWSPIRIVRDARIAHDLEVASPTRLSILVWITSCGRNGEDRKS